MDEETEDTEEDVGIVGGGGEREAAGEGEIEELEEEGGRGDCGLLGF